jgi:hypothetical protein
VSGTETAAAAPSVLSRWRGGWAALSVTMLARTVLVMLAGLAVVSLAPLVAG